MRIHFIAIGGAIMHQLAIELQANGHEITGSDDEIFEPARTNLFNERLLPETISWRPELLNVSIDAVILGMHAKADNPELLRAQELGLKIYSFPEFIYEFSRDKKRIVVAGSHGKTSTTSMIMHVLKNQGLKFDYLVGAKVEGFEKSVKLSDAPIIILEGDEYPASTLELRPKIHFYQPHISILTGIEWDHINVFPTYENYVEQFEVYLQHLKENKAILYYCKEDNAVLDLISSHGDGLNCIPYGTPKYEINDDGVSVFINDKSYNVNVFGAHNLQNMEAAKAICMELGINEEQFFQSIESFTGAARRLEKISETSEKVVFRDFAHAPSKVRATLKAVRERYPNYKLIACLELHTFSSLNEKFHAEYKNTLIPADAACVYYSSHALQLKRLPMLNNDLLKNSFNQKTLAIFNNNAEMKKWINDEIFSSNNPVCLLMMSSGTYDNLSLDELLNTKM